MHSYKLAFLFIIGFIGCKSSQNIPQKYDVKPVLLHMSKTNQPDSLGFNLVSSIHNLLYPRIVSGDIALWKTPKKQVLINKEQFKQLEKESNRDFKDNEDLFIHEYWQLLNKHFEFSVSGLSFVGVNRVGQPISYGFIDAVDVINLLKTTRIPANQMGPSDLSYWNAIHSKLFNFNVVQFGNLNFKSNPEQSLLIKNQACFSKKVTRAFYVPRYSKRITYRIINPEINSNPENKIIYSTANQQINKNKQIILNMIQRRISSEELYLNWEVSSIRVVEKWSSHKSLPFQELEKILFKINGNTYSLSKQELSELGMTINLQGIAEYLSEKNFDFLIEKVNSEPILPQQSEDLYSKLIEDLSKNKPYDKN